MAYFSNIGFIHHSAQFDEVITELKKRKKE